MQLKSHVENLHKREDSGKMAVTVYSLLNSSNPHIKEQSI